MDENMINQGPQFIAYMVKELEKREHQLSHLLRTAATLMLWNL